MDKLESFQCSNKVTLIVVNTETFLGMNAEILSVLLPNHFNSQVRRKTTFGLFDYETSDHKTELGDAVSQTVWLCDLINKDERDEIGQVLDKHNADSNIIT